MGLDFNKWKWTMKFEIESYFKIKIEIYWSTRLCKIEWVLINFQNKKTTQIKMFSIINQYWQLHISNIFIVLIMIKLILHSYLSPFEYQKVLHLQQILKKFCTFQIYIFVLRKYLEVSESIKEFQIYYNEEKSCVKEAQQECNCIFSTTS